MNITVATQSQYHSQLWICTEKSQLPSDNAQLVFDALGEKDSFVSANIPVSGSLQAIAVLRFTDLKVETLQKGAKEAATWLAKQEQVSVDINPFCEVDSPRVTEALIAAIGEAVYRFDDYKKREKSCEIARS